MDDMMADCLECHNHINHITELIPDCLISYLKIFQDFGFQYMLRNILLFCWLGSCYRFSSSSCHAISAIHYGSGHSKTFSWLICSECSPSTWGLLSGLEGSWAAGSSPSSTSTLRWGLLLLPTHQLVCIHTGRENDSSVFKAFPSPIWKAFQFPFSALHLYFT